MINVSFKVTVDTTTNNAMSCNKNCVFFKIHGTILKKFTLSSEYNHRALDVAIIFLLFPLLIYLLTLNKHAFDWLLSLLCHS